MNNTIILKAEGNLIDKEARGFCLKIDRRLENVNDRTKRHTLEIKKIEKELKELRDGK